MQAKQRYDQRLEDARLRNQQQVAAAQAAHRDACQAARGAHALEMERVREHNAAMHDQVGGCTESC